MKIVTWNCNMKFREKFNEIKKLDADIYIIQECEDPNDNKVKEYEEWATNYLWIGERNFKGLGVFAKENIKLEQLKDNGDFKLFLPIRVNNTFNLLAVGAMPKYIQEIHNYYEANKQLFNKELIMCGDFNSNTFFNKYHPKNKNHTTFIKYLEEDGLVDCYHCLTGEEQGEETVNTFYQVRHKDEPFHLDHVIAAPEIIKDLEILDTDYWLTLSDHMPIVFNINENHYLTMLFDEICENIEDVEPINYNDLRTTFLEEFYTNLKKEEIDEDFINSLKELMNNNNFNIGSYQKLMGDVFDG